MTTKPLTAQERQNIHTALLAVAGVCDGAHTLDNAGFSKFDVATGMMLAGLAQSGSLGGDSEYYKAVKFIRKYQRQIPNIPLPTPPDNNDMTVYVRGSYLYLQFPGKPSPETLEKIKEIPGRSWRPDEEGKPWRIAPGKGIEKFLELFPGEKTETIEALINKTENTPVKDVANQILRRDRVFATLDGGIVLVFIEAKERDKFNSLIDTIKTLPDRSFDGTKKAWKITKQELPKLVELIPGIELDEPCQEILKTMRELAGLSDQSTSKFRVSGLKGEPYPFQNAGIEFLILANGRAIIGDEMGLGKTIQALGYIQHTKPEKWIVVCPASLKLNWLKEATAWLEDSSSILIANGNPPLIPPHTKGLIINYDILGKWDKTIREWKPVLMVCDEAHYCKNSKTARSKATKALSKTCKEVVLLTGTPIDNRTSELFPLLNIVAAEAWPNFFHYAREYCGAYQTTIFVHGEERKVWKFDGASNLTQLHEAIRPYVVRRTKAQVLKELPPKTRSIVPIKFDRTEYNRVLATVKSSMRGGGRTNQLQAIEAAKQAAAISKLPGVIDWITDFLESDEKLVVFATHHSVINALKEKFGSAAVILTGEQNDKERDKAVTSFQSDPRVKLFIGNIKAAGIGLTLTASSNVAFVEFPWTPGAFQQAEDRVHRIGQLDAVTSWSLVADKTIDNKIADILITKARIADAVIDGRSTGSLDILDELLQELEREGEI